MLWEDDLGNSWVAELANLILSITSKYPIYTIQTIGTSQEAVQLADVGTPGYAFFKNLDPTNFVDLKVATGGAIFARLDKDTTQDGKGGMAFLRLGSGATAPYAIADTAACRVLVAVVPSV